MRIRYRIPIFIAILDISGSVVFVWASKKKIRAKAPTSVRGAAWGSFFLPKKVDLLPDPHFYCSFQSIQICGVCSGKEKN